MKCALVNDTPKKRDARACRGPRIITAAVVRQPGRSRSLFGWLPKTATSRPRAEAPPRRRRPAAPAPSRSASASSWPHDERAELVFPHDLRPRLGADAFVERLVCLARDENDLRFGIHVLPTGLREQEDAHLARLLVVEQLESHVRLE